MGKKKKKKKFGEELKKTLRGARKANSNKLIYAVVGGLALLLIAALLITLLGDKKPQDKKTLILEAVDYLHKVANITEIKAVPEENKVVLVFDAQTTAGSKKDVDFKKIARYAGVRVSHELKDEEVKILLSELKKREKDYLVTVKNGEVTSEEILE